MKIMGLSQTCCSALFCFMRALLLLPIQFLILLSFSCYLLSLLTLFPCTGRLPLTIMYSVQAAQGPGPEGTRFQAHLLQDVMDSNSQFVALCCGRQTQLPSQQTQHHRVGFWAELQRVDYVVVKFILVPNCATQNQR